MATMMEREGMLALRPFTGTGAAERVAHLEAEVSRLNQLWREPVATFTSADLWNNQGGPARFRMAAAVAVDEANIALAEARGGAAREALDVLTRRDDVGREAASVAEAHAAMAVVQTELDRLRGEWLSARGRLDLAEMRRKLAEQAVRDAEATARRWRNQLQADGVDLDRVQQQARLAGVGVA
jgi:hypothetical protein